MRTCTTHRRDEPNRWRLRPWQAAAVCAMTLVSLAMFGAGIPQSSAQASTRTAAASAPVPVVGVQDSWINSCDKGGAPNFNPKGKDPAVPAVDGRRWRALGMDTVRFSPPWDIAMPVVNVKHMTVVRACFQHWLQQLAKHHVTPEIAFKPDTGYKTPTGHVRIPTLSQYVAAMKAFFSLYGSQVTIISPWGEPEFHPKGGKGPDYQLKNGSAFDATHCPKHATDANCGPALAAQMWVAVTHLCPSCTVTAGDFGSNGSKDLRYLAIYHRFLRDIHGGPQAYRPKVWAIHPYTDIIRWEHQIKHGESLTKPRDTLVAGFAGQLARDGYHGHTQIWLDEVSSFTVSPSIYKGEKYSRPVQAKGAYELLTQLVKAGGASTPGEPVVKRIYYMRMAGGTTDALVFMGHAEPIYTTFVNWRKTHPAAQPAPEASAARATSAASTAAAPTRYTIRNAADNLCLDATDKGPAAGQNGDEVRLWTCYGSANQEWIPVYDGGNRLAWLENAMYPAKCLNANNVGGFANGRRVQLWNCYNGTDELWDFGGLLANGVSHPLTLGAGAGSFVLDADKYDLGNGDKVQLWNFYGADSQRWYPVPA
jgi:hypothetical protein